MKKFKKVKVVKGAGRGRKIGVPTINLLTTGISDLDFGIYVCRVDFGETEYWGAMHFGPRPTFKDEEVTLEVFLFDFARNTVVPGELDLEVLDFIRPIKKFENAENMVLQIEDDVNFAKGKIRGYLGDIGS